MQGQPIQIHLGHNFNWEWGNAALSLAIPHKVAVVYILFRIGNGSSFPDAKNKIGSGMIPALL